MGTSDTELFLVSFGVGGAGDQAREAVTPLSQAPQGAIEVAAQAGAAVQQQAQGSADFKNAFPPPYQVPPDNIGWADYVNPVSYGFKSGVRAAHEEKHDQVEEQARQQYESYTQATNERVNGIQQFPPPPTFTGDVTTASTTPVNKVDPSTSYTSTSTTSSTPSGNTTSSSQSSSVPHTSSTPSPSAPTPSGHSSTSPSPQAPAGSSSSWTTPPAASGTTVPGTAAPTPAPGGGGTGRWSRDPAQRFGHRHASTGHRWSNWLRRWNRYGTGCPPRAGCGRSRRRHRGWRARRWRTVRHRCARHHW
ncbi:hypothetical protein [Saccharopolyspora hirsuta]|uniref:hypothetical protein n=1 Tax=Saccharopolyspora hirsuta TaxID=1837 RepID=UPI0024830BC1|nr:hypothetical protein [Saccharopolyspora hirsuta]